MNRHEAQRIRWLDESPDAGDPNCLCSYCAERIEAQREIDEGETQADEDEGEPIRMWTNGGKDPCKEARFHAKCFTACLELGLFERVP